MPVSTRTSMGLSRLPATGKIPHCTHLQLTRLFDEYGCEKCSICHRRPQLGWLYRCTQDFGGFLPASDFFDTGETEHFNHDAQLYTLERSIIEAAQKGHYTDKELNVLWRQKIEVRRSIQQARPTTSSTASTVSSSQYSLPPSTTTSTVPSSDGEPETRTEWSQPTEYPLPCRGLLEPIREVRSDLENDYQPSLFTKASPPSPCNFRVCQNCRPIYRERAWQSIDSIVTLAYQAPPKHEIYNRRISDLQIVRTLGLGKKFKECDPDSFDVDNGKTGSRANFQETVQRLLKHGDTSECIHQSTLRRTKAHRNLAKLDGAGLADSSTSKISLTHSQSPNQANVEIPAPSPRPLFARRGFERLTTIEPPSSSAVSSSRDSSSSPALSTDQSNISSPTTFVLKIDVAKANEVHDNMPLPQKTPTDSLRESLKRFGIVGKARARFPID